VSTTAITNRFLLLAVLAAACSCGGAPAASRTLVVRNAWARQADSGTTTAVYLTMVNGSASPVSYTSASSPLAASVSLHETMAMDGMVHMMPLDTAQAIAAGDSLVLAEGGKHLMVSGLRRKLAAGDSLPLLLTFGGGRSVQLAATVRAP
jgi:copper(I)-binding protein